MHIPAITVLMPAYNAEKYIRKSINSILSQTFSDFILLIIDDGSTDDTEKIIASYTDIRIQYLKNAQNIGLVNTLNKGIALVQTEFIARMDADDIAVVQRLEWQVAFMRQYPDVGVSGGRYRIFGNETGVPEIPLTHGLIKSWLLFASLICHPAVIMRSQLFQDISIRYGVPFEFDDEYGHKILELEDFALWHKLKSLTKFANIDKVLIEYRREGQNLTAHKTELIFERKKKYYRFLLSELDISPSPFNLALHISLKYIAHAQSPDDLISFRNYLDELLAQNFKKNIYPQASLEKVITQQWNDVFYYLPNLGISYIWAYIRGGKTIKYGQFLYFFKFSLNRIMGRK